MAGRPPKTIEVKKSEGTFREDRELERYAKYEPVRTIPAITKDLNKDGIAFFNHYCQVMIDQGLMTTAFITDFENAAYYHQSCKIFQRKLTKEGYIMVMGNGYKQVSPWWKMLLESTKALAEFSNKYGLNLAASQRISVPNNSPDEFDQ